MDDLAHALAGTLMGRANPSKARGLVLACVLGTLAPDLDVFPSYFVKDFYITEHRGFTHSLLGLLPVSLFAAWLAWWFTRKLKDRASFKAIWGMALIGVVSHILLDWCTSWGTMILWPNRTRLALDHLFIIDPWYWGLLALPILFSYFYKSRRAAICSGGIVLVLLYHGLAAFNHHEAIFILKKDKPGASVLAFPQPFSPFRWSAFSRGNGLLKNARIDFLKSAQPLEWQQWPEPPITPNIKAAMESPEGKRYLWFARVPLWEEEKQPDGSVEVGFWDLRFQNNFTKERVTKRFKTVIKVKDGRVIDSR